MTQIIAAAVNPGPQPSRLPDGYTEVKCLRLDRPNIDASGTGKQEINTGVVPSATQAYECVFARDSRYVVSSINTYAVFGGKHSQSKGMGAALWINKDGDISFVFGGPNGETGYQSTGMAVDVFHTVNANMADGILSFDGAQIATKTPQSITGTPATINLFNQHNASGASVSTGEAPVKIKSWKAWDNGTLICDLVSCLRDSDERPGMYDLVANKFITNLKDPSRAFSYESL